MIFKLFIASTCVVAAAYPQQARIEMRAQVPPTKSSATRPTMEATRPLLGYVPDGGTRLRSVAGSSANPIWGEPVTLPASTAQAFLPPGQEYALLASDAGLSNARLSRSGLLPGSLVAGAIARPDQVAFSPSSSAAALVSNSERRIQTLTYRSGMASVASTIGFLDRSGLLNLAVSDDGELLVAIFASQPPVYSLEGSPWRELGTGHTPGACAFLPHSHDVILSDPFQRAIVLHRVAEGSSTVTRVLLPEGGDTNLIASDKQGTHVLAAIDGTSKYWLLDLASGSAEHLSSPVVVHSLTFLRDGETFLISAEEAPAVISLRSEASQAIARAGVR